MTDGLHVWRMSATLGQAGVVQVGVCRFVGGTGNFVTLSTASQLAGWPESTLKSKLRALTGTASALGNGWVVMRDKLGLKQLKEGGCLAPTAPKVALIQLGLLHNMAKEAGAGADMDASRAVIRELYHLADAHDPVAETALRAMEAQQRRGRLRREPGSSGGVHMGMGVGGQPESMAWASQEPEQVTPSPYAFLGAGGGGGGGGGSDEGFDGEDQHGVGDEGDAAMDADWTLSEEERELEDERKRAEQGQVAGAGHRRMTGQGVRSRARGFAMLHRNVNVANVKPYTRPTFGPNHRFPETLPVTLLQPTQITERYGFDEASLPRQAKAEIRGFEAWSTDGINLSRTERYSRGVQTDTIAKHRDRIRGVLGWVCTYFDVPPKDVGLAEYADPDKVFNFIAYLKTRGVGR
jgi:hypothetical protein